MAIVRRLFLALAASAVTLPLIGAAPGFAAILGPNPVLCDGSDEPTILVRVSGLKSRSGTVRVRTFNGGPNTYFNKKHAQHRLQYPVPASGAVDICVPVGQAGIYAVDVRHDANGNDDTDRADGVGASGNPKFSLFNIIFGKKPAARQVQISVGQGTTIVPITVRYL